ncbi:unnamed protein product [Closterium sp. NIES-65]|nr:unnamed protein product [Closterium sp. NIES-65]
MDWVETSRESTGLRGLAETESAAAWQISADNSSRALPLSLPRSCPAPRVSIAQWSRGLSETRTRRLPSMGAGDIFLCRTRRRRALLPVASVASAILSLLLVACLAPSSLSIREARSFSSSATSAQGPARALYIVHLRSAPPIVSYRGGIPGFPPIAPPQPSDSGSETGDEEGGDTGGDPSGNAGGAGGAGGTAGSGGAGGAAGAARAAGAGSAHGVTASANGGKRRQWRVNPRLPHVRAFKRMLQRQQRLVAAHVGLRAEQLLYSYAFAGNSFAALLSPQQVWRLSRHPAVAAVRGSAEVRALTTATPAFLQLPQSLWAAAGGEGSAGEGVVVGVVDTGIWPEHRSFANDVHSGCYSFKQRSPSLVRRLKSHKQRSPSPSFSPLFLPALPTIHRFPPFFTLPSPSFFPLSGPSQPIVPSLLPLPPFSSPLIPPPFSPPTHLLPPLFPVVTSSTSHPRPTVPHPRPSTGPAPPPTSALDSKADVSSFFFPHPLRSSPPHQSSAPYGPPPSSFKGACPTSSDFPATACSGKLVGGGSFRAALEAGGTRIDWTREYASPRDAVGHGTWCAGAAAGNGNTAAQVSATQSLGRASGMAPRARIAMYKVLWRVAGGYGSGNYADLFAAVDQAVSDGVDVLSLSLGGYNPSATYFDDLPFLRAFEAGIVVVFAAGNAGHNLPLPFARTVYNFFPYYITVGAR